jgi:tRNA pseudouridine55 synthase
MTFSHNLKKSVRVDEELSGLLVVDKPAGLTSFDCVHRVKRILQVKKVGHCGTLDPMAKGVLLLLIGKSTREQENYLGLQKQYRFRGQWGQTTDTGDREGVVTEIKAFSHITQDRLESVLREFEGTQSQTPPRYAALKYKGKPYYRWARMGVEIPRVPRPIEIYSLELLSWEGAFWEARVCCSRGTYIRTLVEDIARRLDTVGMLDDLVRERVGSFTQSEALSWPEVERSTREELSAHFQCAAPL